MPRGSALLGILLCAALACGGPDPAPTPGEVVLAWNARVLGIAEAEDGFYTLKGLRTASMMHLAMHDAINAIRQRYQPYHDLDAAPASKADPVAAAARAAHEVAVSQYPDRADSLDAELARWQPQDVTQEVQQASDSLGRAAAAAILELRSGDDWNAQATYEWHPMGPGVYAEFAEHSGTPEGFVFGAGWAVAKPFMLPSPSAFRTGPPPAITSAAYGSAFNEVKDVGATLSATRTPDQTHLALWWKPFAEKSHNQLARELAGSDSLDLWETARLFALLNMSIYDGYIAVFDSKFHYNHWRPYTAIRWASHDGNPGTAEDPAWDNTHRHTYAFPSYPSAHGTVCAAGMTVLADAFGNERRFTMHSPVVDSAGPGSGPMRMDPPTRDFDSFSGAAWECSLSRVYLGIHFRYDSEQGTALGTRIGRFAVDGFLAEVP